MSAAKYWSWTNPKDADNEIEAVASAGLFTISVSDEQAMDGYNEKFTCDIAIPADQARALRDWLTDALNAWPSD